MITAKAFAGKKYAVYGLARSGLATAEALLASGASVTGWDSNEEARAQAPDGTVIANLDEADLGQFDSLVVTPGLPLNRHPIAERARDAGVEIIGDIELFARARPELPPHKVVGITGTNGKSTTTALIHHILKTAGVPTTMGGNIGLPILTQDPLPEGGVYVLELSSYQIDLTHSLDCDVAVLLNITPDHLDRYENIEAYAMSKARIFEMQSPGHVALLSRRAEKDFRVLRRALSLQVIWIDDVPIGPQSSFPSLQGNHNLQNAKAASQASLFVGVRLGEDIQGLRSFPGLSHRMERVRTRNGVRFVNDSKATNAEAAAPALSAFSAIRWIVGGQAKTEDLGELIHHLDHVKTAYTIGEAGSLLARLLREQGVEVVESETLENALNHAAKDSQAGDTVLLSPACASFDQFKDFEQRGDRFKDLVGAL